MSKELQQRAQQFLKRPIPTEMKYVRGSFAENIIAGYSNNGRIENDPELTELLSITVMDSQGAAEKAKGDEKAYFTESAQILEAILAEISGDS